MTQANPAGNLLTIVSLQTQGRLCKGDTVSTDVLGTCDVLGIIAPDALRVRQRTTRQEVLISGIDFPPGVQFQAKDPRDSISRT